MDLIPFGISELDSRVGGGALPGNFILLVEDIGAGARQFMHTSSIMSGLQRVDRDSFDLHYGQVPGEASFTEEVHYVSFTESEAELLQMVSNTIDPELAEKGFEGLTFRDFSTTYFHQSTIPPEWYSDGSSSESGGDITEAVGNYLNENAPGNLVLIDSLNDLITLTKEEMRWSDFILLIKGIRKASRSWDGLILAHMTRESLRSHDLAELEDAADAVIYFEWEESRHERVRTMFLKKFLGVLPYAEETANVFEAGVRDEGYYISAIEKIL